MKHLVAILLAACAGASAAEERPLVFTAGQLMALCAVQDRASESALICAALLRGFSDGYEHGANRGLVVAFVADPANMATTRGVDDAQRRVNRLREVAECVPRGTTGSAIMDTFARYMAANPARADQSYRLPLADALEARYCPG